MCICETIKRSGTLGTVWRAISRFTMGNGSIRAWATDHQRRYTADERAILNGLRAKISNEAPPNLFCPKNGLDNGAHLTCSLPQGHILTIRGNHGAGMSVFAGYHIADFSVLLFQP